MGAASTVDVLFLTSSQQQLDAARSVQTALGSDARTWHLDPYTTQTVVDASLGRSRTGKLALRRIAASARWVARWVREHPDAVVVAGQDFSLCERVCLAAARRGGARLALLPDGVAMDAAQTQPRRLQLLADGFDHGLRRAGLAIGERGRFGASNPDLLCSWGDGWNELWQRAAPRSSLVVTGAPGRDRLASVPPPPSCGNLLICSQEFSLLLPDSHEAQQRWWQAVADLAAAGCDRTDLRIRLHPVEVANGRERLLPDSGADLLSSAPLEDDLAWADAVVAPTSTVVLEAVVTGRHAATVDLGLDTVLDQIACFAPGAIPRVSLDTLRTARAAGVVDAWGDASPERVASRFLAHNGVAARHVARAILES